jgi:hypothetical protein
MLDQKAWKSLSEVWSQSSRSGIKSIKFDYCTVRNTDLALMMQQMSKNLIVTEISAEHCNLQLKKDEEWMPILDAVRVNCSLVKVYFGRHQFNPQFLEELEVELQ